MPETHDASDRKHHFRRVRDALHDRLLGEQGGTRGQRGKEMSLDAFLEPAVAYLGR